MDDANPKKAEGDALYKKKQYGAAVTAYTAAMRAAPRDHRLYSNRAACCEKLADDTWAAEKQGWLDCGLGDARKCVQLAPAWPKGYCRLAAACRQAWEHARETAWENDDYDEEAAARSIGRLAPSRQHPGCFSAAARARCAELRREAEDGCRRGLALAPDDAYLRTALNRLRDDPDHEPRARDAYPAENYAKDEDLRRPDLAAQRKDRGNEEFAKKDYATAEKAYGSGLALDPCCAVLYANRSACRAHRHDYRGALRDAEKSVRFDEKWPKGRLRLATALYGLGEYQNALDAVDAGLALSPDNVALTKLRPRVAKDAAEPEKVQKELHRLREDQRNSSSLNAHLAGLANAGGAGPDMMKDVEQMMSKMGMPPGMANMGGLGALDLGNLPKAAAQEQPKLSEAQMRRVARERAGIAAAAPPPPPPEDDVVEVGADGAFEA